jgi:hypothetical protein
MVRVGNYDYTKSTRAGKKLMVEVQGKTIHFGSSAMEHYKDRTGIWSHLDHNDMKRQASYLSRSAGIRDKQGRLTKDNPLSSNYHARRVMWL